MSKAIESIRIFTPLGIRFWDPVRQAQVSDGLRVIAYPQDEAGPSRHAFRTASGIYAFQGLPGLIEIEYLSETGEPWASLPFQRTYAIEALDTYQRFLPMVFQVDLPLPYPGLYLNSAWSPSALGSQPASPFPGFNLFSSPTRRPSPGVAEIRATLEEAPGGAPAAFAVIEASVEGSLWAGIADGRGCAAVMFPYPGVRPGLVGSLPGALSGPVQEASWTVSLRVRYQPDALVYLPGIEVPDLRSILRQSVAQAWLTQSGPALDQWNVELPYGQELVLRTGTLSSLWITQ